MKIILSLFSLHLARVQARCGNQNDFNPAILNHDSNPRINYPPPPPVNLTVHIIAAGPSRDDGNVTQAEIDNQIQIIKDAYRPLGITFNHTRAHNRWILNPDWSGRQVGRFFDPMKTALHVGDYRTLNLYFRNITAIDFGGHCTNPESEFKNEPDAQKRLRLDGCVISIYTLPGENHRFMNEGKSAVHEIGHWFGLYHPFHDNGLRENNMNPDPCSETNPDDHVVDTPKMKLVEKDIGVCNLQADSCPKANGSDAVRNYMSYSSDECMTEFTRGQGERIYEIWARFRSGA